MANQQDYECRSIHALRFYAGQRGLGLHPVDVESYLGKRVSIYKLTKAELVELHLALDRAGRGLGKLFSHGQR